MPFLAFPFLLLEIRAPNHHQPPSSRRLLLGSAADHLSLPLVASPLARAAAATALGLSCSATWLPRAPIGPSPRAARTSPSGPGSARPRAPARPDPELPRRLANSPVASSRLNAGHQGAPPATFRPEPCRPCSLFHFFPPPLTSLCSQGLAATMGAEPLCALTRDPPTADDAGSRIPEAGSAPFSTPRRHQISAIPAVPHRPALLPEVTSPYSPSPLTGFSPRPGESRLLAAKAAAARRLERRRLLLERRAVDLASRALAARAGINATHARRLAVARDISSTNGEIEDAQQKAEEWDRFYESKRKEMEEFRPSSPQPPSTPAAATSQPHEQPPGLVPRHRRPPGPCPPPPPPGGPRGDDSPSPRPP
ncbi:vegetative cell wall protein gp1-like [Triticum aestivum]|uniref:vegetative cell wall protein gp1-like n=1 Tax=Triticum aestivum TaxID=4565 RepID=UPI001D028BE1|nr:vegetative cell wall protein gp1-like [Triticum aestivum]